jgi:hypothetical protein
MDNMRAADLPRSWSTRGPEMAQSAQAVQSLQPVRHARLVPCHRQKMGVESLRREGEAGEAPAEPCSSDPFTAQRSCALPSTPKLFVSHSFG